MPDVSTVMKEVRGAEGGAKVSVAADEGLAGKRRSQTLAGEEKDSAPAVAVRPRQLAESVGKYSIITVVASNDVRKVLAVIGRLGEILPAAREGDETAAADAASVRVLRLPAAEVRTISTTCRNYQRLLEELAPLAG